MPSLLMIDSIHSDSDQDKSAPEDEWMGIMLFEELHKQFVTQQASLLASLLSTDRENCNYWAC